MARMEDCGIRLKNNASELNSLVEIIVKIALAIVVVAVVVFTSSNSAGAHRPHSPATSRVFQPVSVASRGGGTITWGGWRRGGGGSSSRSSPCLTPVEFDEQGRDVSAEKTVMNSSNFHKPIRKLGAKLIPGSLDVKKLYPSLKIEKCGGS